MSTSHPQEARLLAEQFHSSIRRSGSGGSYVLMALDDVLHVTVDYPAGVTAGDTVTVTLSAVIDRDEELYDPTFHRRYQMPTGEVAGFIRSSLVTAVRAATGHGNRNVVR